MTPGHRTFPIRQGLCDVDVVHVAWALSSGDQKCPNNFFCSQITDRCLPAAFLGKGQMLWARRATNRSRCLCPSTWCVLKSTGTDCVCTHSCVYLCVCTHSLPEFVRFLQNFPTRRAEVKGKQDYQSCLRESGLCLPIFQLQMILQVQLGGPLHWYSQHYEKHLARWAF